MSLKFQEGNARTILRTKVVISSNSKHPLGYLVIKPPPRRLMISTVRKYARPTGTVAASRACLLITPEITVYFKGLQTPCVCVYQRLATIARVSLYHGLVSHLVYRSQWPIKIHRYQNRYLKIKVLTNLRMSDSWIIESDVGSQQQAGRSGTGSTHFRRE